jgi:transposase
MAYIRKVKTASGATAVQICYKFKGKVVKLKHIGSAHNQTELKILLDIARKELSGDQLPIFPEEKMELQVEIKRSYSELLWNVLKAQYEKLGFGELDDEVFLALCIARIVEPTSKVESLRVLADLGVEQFDRNQLYRCLVKVNELNYREKIGKACYGHALDKKISLVLYDVTTLYFEAQKEDGFRKPGMSKERRLEPQIIIGLVVDRYGFPLGLHSFEGNKAETKTILPVIEAFQMQHNLGKLTIVADAAMLSSTNLIALTEAGHTYVVGSRLRKIPYEIEEYQKDHEFEDGQIVVSHYEGYRVIYQYRSNRAALDIRNIQKQLEKAKKIVEGKLQPRKNKFLSLKSPVKEVNQTLVDKAYRLAGIKGYVTNLKISDKDVIAFYHQLFQVEATFRMAKSDLKARPIFHRKRDSIEAHLTIVFAALAMSKKIEFTTKKSIRQVVKTLQPLRSGVVLINGNEVVARPNVPSATQTMLKKLISGH